MSNLYDMFLAVLEKQTYATLTLKRCIADEWHEYC